MHGVVSRVSKILMARDAVASDRGRANLSTRGFSRIKDVDALSCINMDFMLAYNYPGLSVKLVHPRITALIEIVGTRNLSIDTVYS
jgi:hypothetical protein